MYGQGITISGEIQRQVFFSSENGYGIYRFQLEKQKLSLFDDDSDITVVGNLGDHSEGTWLKLNGQWITNPKFGRQFKVTQCNTVIPQSSEGMIRFLSSGVIKGVGPAIAKRIVKLFGTDTFEIMDSSPEKLLQVEGIGQQKLVKICTSWNEKKHISEAMSFLQGHGLGAGTAYKVVKKFKKDTITMIQEDPYRLSKWFWGIGFKTADKIALSLGIPKDSPLRIKEVIHHVLSEAVSDGNIYLTKRALLKACHKLVAPFVPEIMLHVETLQEEERVVVEGDKFYTSKMWKEETGVAEHIKRLLGNKIKKEKLGKIDLGEFTISEEQQEAVEMVFNQSMTVITGGPGTGKTTMVKAIVAHGRALKYKIALAAPTGRAAKRLSEASGMRATTIHRLLVYQPGDGGFIHNEETKLYHDLILVDESSMVDISLMYSLIQAVKDGARLVMVGDVNQLPSVGPGEILKSCIASGSVATKELTHIYRQAAQSAIVRCSYEILNGWSISHGKGENGDCYFVEQDNSEDIIETVRKLVGKRIPDAYALNPMSEIQVLVPKHKGTLGTERFNEVLQDVLNLKGMKFKRGTKEWRVGDKIMQTKNNYSVDVFNGDMGIIKAVNLEKKELTIKYDDGRVIERDMADMLQMAPAFAITIHKSQGSEYPAVILPMHTQYSIMLQRNLLYTAVTRAKTVVVIVGSKRALNLAISNNMKKKRNSVLQKRIAGKSNE